MKVLIVDDEELIRNVIKEYLVLNDYEYGEVETGKQAVEKIGQNVFFNNGSMVVIQEQ